MKAIRSNLCSFLAYLFVFRCLSAGFYACVLFSKVTGIDDYAEFILAQSVCSQLLRAFYCCGGVQPQVF